MLASIRTSHGGTTLPGRRPEQVLAEVRQPLRIALASEQAHILHKPVTPVVGAPGCLSRGHAALQMRAAVHLLLLCRLHSTPHRFGACRHT